MGTNKSDDAKQFRAYPFMYACTTNSLGLGVIRDVYGPGWASTLGYSTQSWPVHKIRARLIDGPDLH